MKKKVIALAVAGAMTGAISAAQAADVNVSGFAAFSYIISNDFSDPTSLPTDGNLVGIKPDGTAGDGTAGKFVGSQDYTGAGEVDIQSGAIRVDLDLDAASGIANVEQARIDTQVGGVDLTVGKFNSPVGKEAQDITDRTFTRTGLLYEYQPIDLAGAMISMNASGADIKVGLVNETSGVAKGGSGTASDVLGYAEELGFVAAASMDVMEGLNVGVGILGQSDYSDTAPTNLLGGTIFDLTADYTMDMLNVGIEFMSSDAVDTAYGIEGGYDLGNGVTLAARYDALTAAAAGSPDTTGISFNATYALADDVDARFEYTSEDDGTDTGNIMSIDFIGTF